MAEAAVTKLDPVYPGFVNLKRIEDGTFVLTVRADATQRGGFYVCGFAADAGKPGRCVPGDRNCNNYCNMAPQKGPMQDHPNRCTHTKVGDTVELRLSSPAVSEFLNAADDLLAE